MSIPQPTMLPGIYTLAAGAAQLEAAYPAASYGGCKAWASDRLPTPGYVISNGSQWNADIGLTTLGAPTARTLALGTAYQATDPTKAAIFTINLNSTATFSVIGGTNNQAEVVVGPTNAVAGGTGMSQAKYSNTSTATVAVGVGVSSAAGVPVTIPLAIGQWLAIRQISGTIVITSTFENALG